MREARRPDGVIEFVPHVGDFVAADEPLFALHGGAAAIDEANLRESVVFGTERTLSTRIRNANVGPAASFVVWGNKVGMESPVAARLLAR